MLIFKIARFASALLSNIVQGFHVYMHSYNKGVGNFLYLFHGIAVYQVLCAHAGFFTMRHDLVFVQDPPIYVGLHGPLTILADKNSMATLPENLLTMTRLRTTLLSR